MERVLEERSRQLILPPEEAALAVERTASVGDSGTVVRPSARPSQSQLRRQRRLERYEQLIAMSKTWQSQAAISRALDMGRKTVRRWLRRGQFPERKPPQGFQGERICRLSPTALE
jgi:hypothetical protein